MKKRKPPVELIEFTSDLVDAAGRSDGPLASLSKTDREFAVVDFPQNSRRADTSINCS